MYIFKCIFFVLLFLIDFYECATLPFGVQDCIHNRNGKTVTSLSFTIDFYVPSDFLCIDDKLIISGGKFDLVFLPHEKDYNSIRRNSMAEQIHTEFLKISLFNYGWNRIEVTVQDTFNQSYGNVTHYAEENLNAYLGNIVYLDRSKIFVANEVEQFNVTGLYSVVNCKEYAFYYRVEKYNTKIPMPFDNKKAFAKLYSNSTIEATIVVEDRVMYLCYNQFKRELQLSNKQEEDNCKINKTIEPATFSLDLIKKDFRTKENTTIGDVVIQRYDNSMDDVYILIQNIGFEKFVSFPINATELNPCLGKDYETPSYSLKNLMVPVFVTLTLTLILNIVCSGVVIYYRKINNNVRKFRYSFTGDIIEDYFTNARREKKPSEKYENESDYEPEIEKCKLCGQNISINKLQNALINLHLDSGYEQPTANFNFGRPTSDATIYELPDSTIQTAIELDEVFESAVIVNANTESHVAPTNTEVAVPPNISETSNNKASGKNNVHPSDSATEHKGVPSDIEAPSNVGVPELPIEKELRG